MQINVIEENKLTISEYEALRKLSDTNRYPNNSPIKSAIRKVAILVALNGNVLITHEKNDANT